MSEHIHITKDGQQIPISKLTDKHLQNILRWHHRLAEEGRTVIVSDGDVYCDEIELKGADMLSYLKHHLYVKEAARRGIGGCECVAKIRGDRQNKGDGQAKEDTVMDNELKAQVIEIAEEVTEARAALRKYASKLRKVAKAVEKYLAGEIERDELLKMYDHSPSGDGYGCDNHYIAPPVKGDECPDIRWVTDTIENAAENMAYILKEAARGEQ